jgi:hypothetical protein
MPGLRHPQRAGQPDNSAAHYPNLHGTHYWTVSIVIGYGMSGIPELYVDCAHTCA